MFFFLPKNIPTPPRKKACYLQANNNASNGPCLRYTIDKYPEIPKEKNRVHFTKIKRKLDKGKIGTQFASVTAGVSAVMPKNYADILS